MGVMDKFLQYMKINDEDENLDEDYLDDEEEIEKPVSKKIVPLKEPEEQEMV